MKERATSKETRATEYGVHLDVLGKALIAQADARIGWHERNAAVMATELQSLSDEQRAPDARPDWERRHRQTDLETKMNGHLEYARFLTFVRENIVGGRRYRLALSDLSVLEIKPRGTY